MSATLLVLAAGMGSRYGGLKQIDPVGPSGEVILDYSVFDARRAGIQQVVFVIRRDIEALFREAIGRRIEAQMDVKYAFQELTDLPEGFTVPPGRSKPWGTTQAILAARSVLSGAFGVINADDFYGADSFNLLAASLREVAEDARRYSLIGFPLRNTVSPHGTVSRGLCTVDAEGNLSGIEECHGIHAVPEGYALRQGDIQRLVSGEETVSMNLWGFPQAFLEVAQGHFADFLRGQGDSPKAECYLPATVEAAMRQRLAQVRVTPSPAQWLGVTYPEDKEAVRAGIRRLIDAGVYPESLWEH